MVSMRKKGIPGLLLRKGVWHIDKIVYGMRICESTRTADLVEAQALLLHRCYEARRLRVYGRTFFEASVKFVAESGHLQSLERDRRTLAILCPFIGALPLQQVHRETLAPFVQARLSKGLSPDTVNRELAVVRRILNLASRVWRDPAGQPWIANSPLIPTQRNPYPREPYPLGVAEQRLLFSELAGHLASMALFKVNTGLREHEVVNLRWQWEVAVPELGTSVFVIPRDFVKNTLDRYVVLNRIARSVIESCRGQHRESVFTYRGNPVTKIYNSGWKAARRRAAASYEQSLGRLCPEGFRRIRLHDLKHTYGHRLRGTGVCLEDRKLLLGHKMRAPMTTHYSAADVGVLIEASERVCDLESRSSPAISVVRSAYGNPNAQLLQSTQAKLEGPKPSARAREVDWQNAPHWRRLPGTG
jgi:integrase